MPQRVLPIYLAVDTSGSMSEGTRLEAVQQAIIQLVDELLSSPALGDQVRVGIVAFADHAELVLPLTDLTELPSLPRLYARGSTLFGPLFQRLGRVIDHDLRVLRYQDTSTLRPFVFLITDGAPADRDWERSFQDFDRRTKAQLIVITTGTGWEGSEIWQRLRPVAVYEWNDNHDEVLATRIFGVVNDFARTLTRSVMLPGRHDARPHLPPPYPPLGEADLR